MPSCFACLTGSCQGALCLVKFLYSLRGAMDDVRTTWPRREAKGFVNMQGISHWVQ
jgi:hypothetical protein